jgi:hypothetical protein
MRRIEQSEVDMKFIIAAFLFVANSAGAFENNCRVQPYNGSADVLINGVSIATFIDRQEAYNALEILKAAGACEPSRCTLGRMRTLVSLIIDGRDEIAASTLRAAVAALISSKANHLCDFPIEASTAQSTPDLD